MCSIILHNLQFGKRRCWKTQVKGVPVINTGENNGGNHSEQNQPGQERNQFSNAPKKADAGPTNLIDLLGHRAFYVDCKAKTPYRGGQDG